MPIADLPLWHPSRHADRRPRLLARNRLVAATRAFFEADGFIEVETPALQLSPGNEAHLAAFATEFVATDGTPQRFYLHTSPEFACKKLVAAGETRLFTLARVFRNREHGRLHHPEFTMLEWYRAGAPYTQLMADTDRLIAHLAGLAGTTTFRLRDRICAAQAPAERLTVADAFGRHAGIDVLATLADNATGAPDRAALAHAAQGAGIRVAPDDTWSDIFSRVLVERIEPHLGDGRPTVLMDYPCVEAALARPTAHDPRVAERFEVYACGVELANAFGELTDPAEQRRRFMLEMDEKERVYGERYPIDEDLLAALALMPPTSGIALGLDRLIMLCLGAERLDDVLWAPVAL
jgi:lysyl-tRNA synthetase class 2